MRAARRRIRKPLPTREAQIGNGRERPAAPTPFGGVEHEAVF
jgi:hypothetical protein